MADAIYTDRDGHALQGHDPVAYFTLGQPTKGDPAISTEWSGATWLFASTTNRDRFLKEPERYAPAFGGHCAVGSAFGMSVRGSARRWRIIDGRLYLNKNRFVALQFPLVAGRVRKLAERPVDRGGAP